MKHLVARPNKLKQASAQNAGFTLIELIVATVIIGILAAISAPSMLAWYNNTKVDDALNQVRGTLKQVQRKAIQKSQTCTVKIDKNNDNEIKVTDCNVIEPDFDDDDADAIAIETNICSNQTKFTLRGTNTLSDTGTIVLFVQDNPDDYNKKCLVISSPLGVIREGDYSGDESSPSASSCTT